jgi:hypothetical protein
MVLGSSRFQSPPWSLDDEGDALLRNAENHSSSDAAFHCRRQEQNMNSVHSLDFNIILILTGRQRRRRRKLLDDLKERRGYSHLKEEALDRTMWRALFGRGFWLVIRQTAKWMNIDILVFQMFSSHLFWTKNLCAVFLVCATCPSHVTTLELIIVVQLTN